MSNKLNIKVISTVQESTTQNQEQEESDSDSDSSDDVSLNSSSDSDNDDIQGDDQPENEDGSSAAKKKGGKCKYEGLTKQERKL